MNKLVLDISEIKKLSVKDLFNKFSSNKKGLSGASVKDRISEYGFNEISEKKSKSYC